MKSKIFQISAAAIVIIAVFFGINQFGGSIDGTSVALGDVLERIEQVQAFMYKMKMTMTGVMAPGMPSSQTEIVGAITIANRFGMKMEMETDVNSSVAGQEKIVQQMYILPDKKLVIMLMPEQKQYMRMEFDDDMLSRMKKQNNDPREMIKQIMNCQYTELGRSVIDGVEVEGFETTDPAFAGGAGAVEYVKVSLWVDVDKWLPVRTELEFKMNEQMEIRGTIYDYQWDVQVDASQFEPVIPEDFNALPTDGMKMPSMTEEAAIEGLEYFVEITGRYPKKLHMMSVMQEFMAIRTNEDLTEAGMKLKEEMNKNQAGGQAEKVMDMMRPIQSLGRFYMMLVQDKKEPAYYGELVGIDDGDMVLLRWKVSDNEYRVIFGDLTAENITTEQLEELERK